MDDLRLNVGCGRIQPQGWVNMDGSNRAKLARRFWWLDRLLVRLKVLTPTEFGPSVRTDDIRKGFSFADNTVAAIYGGEFLEHLTEAQGGRFLAESYRILKPGGVLRLRVPDNYHFWKQYVEQFEAMHRRPRHQWNGEHTRWVRMFFRDICVHKRRFGSMGHFHKWMYDEVSLILAFEKAGLHQVQRRALHDSRIPDVRLVERRSDLTVEGVKPE